MSTVPQVVETAPGTFLVAFSGPLTAANSEAVPVYLYGDGRWDCSECLNGACPHIEAAQAFIEKEAA